jgi:hypothetical protein
MLQILDPFRLLGQLSVALRQLATQTLDFLFQALLGISFSRPLFLSRHASHGTPIALTCTDP